MLHKILLVGLLLLSLLSELVSSTTKASNGSGEACHDNWRLNRCTGMKSQGKCEKKTVAKNCQKTCGLCAGMCIALDYTPHKGCGLSPKSSRIIEGDDVSPHSIPWQVGLLYAFNNYEGIGCGGTLLTNKHVLTAAHCLVPENDDITEASNIRVVVAEHNQNNSFDGIHHEVRSYTNHPQYNQSTFGDYDFSMLHLTVPVNLGNRAVPACLPDLRFSEEKLVGKYLTVSGWGKLEDEGYVYPELLQSVDVPVVSQNDCRKAYLGMDGKFNITNSMICAGGSRGMSVCHDDSGGPLTYKENGRSYLIGVVSFGPEFCAQPESPDVYARVTAVLDWIHKELGSSC